MLVDSYPIYVHRGSPPGADASTLRSLNAIQTLSDFPVAYVPRYWRLPISSLSTVPVVGEESARIGFITQWIVKAKHSLWTCLLAYARACMHTAFLNDKKSIPDMAITLIGYPFVISVNRSNCKRFVYIAMQRRARSRLGSALPRARREGLMK